MRRYVTFLWNNGYRNYLPEHANIWANALHYWDEGCETICITDLKKGFNSNVKVVQLPKSAKLYEQLEAPQGSMFPASYRRLWLFSGEAKTLGERLMLLDVDCMVLGNPKPLWDIDSDFVGWKPNISWGREDRIGGGTWLLKTGKVTWFWDLFVKSHQNIIKETKQMGWNGSDQALLSRYLLPRYPIWEQRSGIYSAQDGVMEWDLPPKDSIFVHFNGENKMWGQNKPWMRAYCNFFK